ncbi:MAG TPA: cardiolipin synthase [Aliidongia sp.]|uniref:cardiolipin synthase n=1 Tax=Aliidongia sp. TaxID=1914230 RepID=UPI002DDD73AA|nr:cardiolipin synthase [Aliidongia sp.]HEV2676589.1 cardiolipin synthase [Aliidongia sp.]
MLEQLSHVGGQVFAETHLLLAVAVTLHVLLRKRDIGGSIGWIGIAWLAPFLGSVLYLVFGINRVTRRAHRLRARRPWRGAGGQPEPQIERTDHLAALDRTARRLTRRPAEGGNSIAMLRNGDEAYPMMLEAIGQARTSVALSSYIFRADLAGMAMIEALIAAHRRGVAVRVLIDGYGSGYFWAATYRRLRRAKVPAARFLHSHLPWRMPFINLRTHKKILCIDGYLGFTGGLNIGAENLVAADLGSDELVRDTHFRIEGPVVGQLTDAFAEDWVFTTGESLSGETWFPPPVAAGAVIARVVTSGPDQDLEKIEYLALQAIASAERSIRIMTPYFLPDDRMLTALGLAAIRGVRVDIIVPRRSDHRPVDWAFRAQIGPLAATGAKIWLSPPPFEHSKLMTVDGLWCLIGSSNWDMRSFRLNFELNMEVYDADLAARLDQFMIRAQRRRLSARRLAKRALPWRLRDAAARLMLPYL